MNTITPYDDGCYIHFHPTTVKVLQAIEDHIGEGYSMTWAKIAEIAGVSVSTLYRHLDALESVDYIWRGERFGDTIQVMSMNDEPDYECENGVPTW